MSSKTVASSPKPSPPPAKPKTSSTSTASSGSRASSSSSSANSSSSSNSSSSLSGSLAPNSNANSTRDSLLKATVEGSPSAEGQKLAQSLENAFNQLPEDKIGAARQEFLDAMESTGPERVERLQAMMSKFEERMDDRGEARMVAGQDPDAVDQDIERSVTDTYKNLAKMAGTPDGQGQLFDQKTRQFLAENFMFHAADPTTMDQGQNSSCWLESGTIVGMINSPEDMARYTQEVALTGGFTSKNMGEGAHNAQGRRFDFNPNIFRAGWEEANWSINNAHQNGYRSPVSKIFDEGMSAMVGRATPDWGNYGGSQGSRRIMHMVTGKVVSDVNHLKGGSDIRTLLEDGAFINYQPRHMKSMHLAKQNGRWAVIQDNQWSESRDRVLGYVDNLQSFGMVAANHRTNPFTPGGNLATMGPNGPNTNLPFQNQIANNSFNNFTNPFPSSPSCSPSNVSPFLPNLAEAAVGGGGGGEGGQELSLTDILIMLLNFFAQADGMGQEQAAA